MRIFSELAEMIGKIHDSMVLSGMQGDLVRMVTNCGKAGLYKQTVKCSKMGLPVIDILRAKHPNIRVPDPDELSYV